MKKRKAVYWSMALILVAVLVTIFVGRNYTPQIVFKDGTGFPDERTQEILSVEQGPYNDKLPLFARKIQVLEHSKNSILYRVYYFPFGSIERSYTQEPDGNWIFNLERPLLGLN